LYAVRGVVKLDIHAPKDDINPLSGYHGQQEYLYSFLAIRG
jgi:hypothetical protein